ncbi:unnamed protein product, partial [Iphiclides podalirius]
MDLVEKTNNISINETTAQLKRMDYIDWKEYFMATAFLAAKRSKDPCYQVGACVVNKENKIVGIGYNGMPTGCSDDEFPWGKNTPSPLDSKFLYEVVYLSDKNAHKPTYIASKIMFDAAGVMYWQFKPKNEKIVINFTGIDWENMSPSK